MSKPFHQAPSQHKGAVHFSDLKSARSAILSGSARSRHVSARGMVSSPYGSSVEGLEEPDAIPLQEMPLPPMPTRVSNIVRRVEVEPEYMDDPYSTGETAERMQRIASSEEYRANPVLNNIKTALVSMYSPLTKMIGNEIITTKNESLDGYQNIGNGAIMQPTSSEAPNREGQEGSTVANIYGLYARSDREEVTRDGYQGIAPPGSLANRLIAPSTPPPKCPLPSLPGQDEVSSVKTPTPVIGSSEIFSDAGESTVPSLPNFKPKNPFRTQIHNSAHSKAPSYADNRHCIYEDQPGLRSIHGRMPLEQEVSEALRRASGFSIYSMGSVSSSILEPGQQTTGRAYEPVPSGPHKLEGLLANDPDIPAAESSFYDPNALVPNQTSRDQNSIRVPIVYHGNFSSSPLASPPNFMPLPGERRSDLQNAFLLSPLTKNPSSSADRQPSGPDDDWETIGESAFRFDGRTSSEYTPAGPATFGTQGYYGGSSIQRAGSSIANTSDAGSLSIWAPEIDHLNSSTDRIAQHPANIEYSGDYRLRELKNTKMPVLLPSYGGNKVNGYLANSSRATPPNPGQWFWSEPKPLKQPHRHPFQTTPPDVASLRTQNMPKSGKKKANHFPRLSKIMREENLVNSTPDGRHASWQHSMTSAGGVTPGFNGDGTKVAGPDRGEGTQTDVNAENTGPVRSLHERLDCRPLVRGPPGAFYQGLRSDGKRKVTGPHQELKPTRHLSRHGTKDYPTNELRPLSLSLQMDFPASIPSKNQGQTSHFYRSPLTPPQRQSWRELYTPEQMVDIERAAKDSTSDRSRTEYWLNNTFRESTLDEMAPRTFFDAPTLYLQTRNSAQGSLRSTKDSVSLAIVLVCAFFPPLLALYLAGHLDRIMRWATGGECTTFTKQGKKVAYVLLFCWGFGAICGLIAFITWWFALRKSH